MSAATDLWASVEEHYQEDGLIDLTNINDRGATTVNTTAGENAAQSVLDLWDMYAQIEYDATKTTHIETARQGVIAMLWRRGGSSSSIAQVRWDEVFANDGLIGKLRATQPRGRQGPLSNNTGVVASNEAQHGAIYSWSDPRSTPRGLRPNPTPVNGYDWC